MTSQDYSSSIILQRYANRFRQHEFRPVEANTNIEEKSVKGLSEKFLIGNESALGIDINLSRMTSRFGITIESFGRAICDAIWLYSIETIGQETLLHGTFIHGFTNDREATGKFIQDQAQRHASGRRGVVIYHTADLSPELSQQLSGFAGPHFKQVQEKLQRGETKELSISLTKGDPNTVMHNAYIGSDDMPILDEYVYLT